MENPFKVDDLGVPPILEKPTPAVSPCDEKAHLGFQTTR